MTPIRRTDQHDCLGNYNISCEASKELDNDQRYFYQQGFLADLPECLGAIKSSSLNWRGNLAPQEEPHLSSAQH